LEVFSNFPGIGRRQDVATKVRLKVAVLAIVALGVLVSASSIASANGGGKKVLKLRAEVIQFEVLDLGDTGPTLGDELVFSETLFRRGREVGVSGVVCTLTQVVPPYGDVLMYHCVGTLSLQKGQITLQGLIELQGMDDPGPFRVAITGGTGAFRGAGGEAVVLNVSETTSIYKLRFDKGKKDGKGKKGRKD
jgi:hypothetical protein